MRSEWRLGMHVGMWSIGSLSGEAGEVHVELRKRLIDVSFPGEMKKQGAKMLVMECRRQTL